MFIVVEGPEGSGKTTLAEWIAFRFERQHRMVMQVREPGGTPLAEAARSLVLSTEHDTPPVAELFLLLAARADLVARVIRPALATDTIVVADRYGLSTIAYQVGGRGLPEHEVIAAHQFATGGLEPDLTLVLDVPVAVGRARQREAGKEQDRFEREGDQFHERVRQAYRDATGPGIVHLDGALALGDVQKAAWTHVAAVTAPSIRGVP